MEHLSQRGARRRQSSGGETWPARQAGFQTDLGSLAPPSHSSFTASFAEHLRLDLSGIDHASAMALAEALALHPARKPLLHTTRPPTPAPPLSSSTTTHTHLPSTHTQTRARASGGWTSRATRPWAARRGRPSWQAPGCPPPCRSALGLLCVGVPCVCLCSRGSPPTSHTMTPARSPLVPPSPQAQLTPPQ
jgi:hypothetical protein